MKGITFISDYIENVTFVIILEIGNSVYNFLGRFCKRHENLSPNHTFFCYCAPLNYRLNFSNYQISVLKGIRRLSVNSTHGLRLNINFNN